MFRVHLTYIYDMLHDLYCFLIVNSFSLACLDYFGFNFINFD